jgi:hypothetical protein
MADKAGCWRDARVWFRRLRRRKQRQTKIEDFEARCEQLKSAPIAEVISANDVNKMGDGPFRQRIQEATANTAKLISVEQFPIHHQDLLSSVESGLADVVVEGDRQTKLSIRGSTFRSLSLSNVGTIHLEDCRIGKLGASNCNPVYEIRNCRIGELDVHKNFPVQRMEWDGGYLGQFHLHEHREGAFVGDVWLHDLELSKDPKHHDVQWLRDARIALNARSNFVAAGVFHASELALSREREPCINRVASLVYQAFSNYGNSIGLPIAWFFGVLAAIFALALATGTAAATDPAAGGWHTTLNGKGLLAQMLRAAIYALQSVFNPLNLIVPKPLVTVSHWGAALATFLLGIVGIAAFALFVLSLRRRFKLE